MKWTNNLVKISQTKCMRCDILMQLMHLPFQISLFSEYVTNSHLFVNTWAFISVLRIFCTKLHSIQSTVGLQLFKGYNVIYTSWKMADFKLRTAINTYVLQLWICGNSCVSERQFLKAASLGVSQLRAEVQWDVTTCRSYRYY